MVERSTSLDQFQTDAEEVDALDYVETNFSTGTANTTKAQIIIRDENVLDQETLVSILEYEKTLRENETVNETLIENNSIQSVANLIATTSIRNEKIKNIQKTQEKLNETKRSIKTGFHLLIQNPKKSIQQVFEEIKTNTSYNLTQSDYLIFKQAVSNLRTGEISNIEISNRNDEEKLAKSIVKNTIQQILSEEEKNLKKDLQELKEIDPTLKTQINQLKSLNSTQINELIADVFSGNTSLSSKALMFMPKYYDPGTNATNATLLVVTQETPGTSFAPGDAPESIERSQEAISTLASEPDSFSTLVYGNGIVSTEILDSMTDSILLVGPLAALFVLIVLIIVYRDLLDIVFGLLGVGLVLVLTFGVMGWLDITFSQPFIVVLVLLIGLSIDYGLHVIMRYREARESSEMFPSRAMAIGLGGVGVALVYTTLTTVIGFLSNLTSPLSIFHQLGVISAIGIVATLAVFGVLIPALKVAFDTFFEKHGISRQKPAIGTVHGPVNRILEVGAKIASKTPYLVIFIVLLLSIAGTYGATQIDASFEQSDFLAEDPANWVKDLPEPFGPRTYTSEKAIDFLNENFVRQDNKASIMIRGDITDYNALEQLEEAQEDVSDMSITAEYASGEKAINSPLTVIQEVSTQNESLNSTLNAADTTGDGVPNQNITAVFDKLYQISPEKAEDFIYRANDEYKALRLVVMVEGDASDEDVREQMQEVAADIEGNELSAISTSNSIVNQITANQLAETAILNLFVALFSVLIVIMIAYRITEGSASLGFVTIIPVAFTLTWVLGTMTVLEIPFNIVTGMITGLTIGLGVDYSLHISERFNQELNNSETIEEALNKTVRGTGGALLSSAATTAGGFTVLMVAILPFLQSFGLITALTIVYAFFASVFVLPSLLVVWQRLTGYGEIKSKTESVEPKPKKAKVERTIEENIVLPKQSIQVKVSLRGIQGRLCLSETFKGNIKELEINPSPITVKQDNGTVTVFWNIKDPLVEATISYLATLHDESKDAEEFTFNGLIKSKNKQYKIKGDDTVTVVSDVLQRILEQDKITDRDLKIAAEDEDITEKEFDRIKRLWLRDEFGKD
ncbi:Patched family protein [archaeon SCG-AAA382B04]|nr:Patched family protein [archaeon SCG-AAA382B04]